VLRKECREQTSAHCRGSEINGEEKNGSVNPLTMFAFTEGKKTRVKEE
jgi:hypothetical protein